MIDQDPPHRLSGNGKEVSPILIGDRLVTEEAYTQLIHQCVWFERVIRALALKETRRDLAQLRMDDGEKPIASVLVALPPIGQPNRDLLAAAISALIESTLRSIGRAARPATGGPLFQWSRIVSKTC